MIGGLSTLLPERDTYFLAGKYPKGTVVITGSASLYQGSQLPAGFSRHSFAGSLPATKNLSSASELKAITPTIFHNLSVKWDCCDKTKDTELVSRNPME